MIETQQYERNPFPVEAVQVTKENLSEVSDWCAGSIVGPKGSQYIKVDVSRAMSERQTRAFPGDWVLYAESGFKVYPDRAFKKNFTLHSEEVTIHEASDRREIVGMDEDDNDVYAEDPSNYVLTSDADKFVPEDKVNPTFTHGDKRVEAAKNINRVTEAHDEQDSRDATTGRFVTEDYAKAHPDTTVTEHVHRSDAHLG